MRRRAVAALLAMAAGACLVGARGAPAARCDTGDGRAFIPAGAVLLGEDGDANPGRSEQVAAFWIDRHEVTNRQFAAFVAATGYRTQAEREGGSAVFVQPATQVSLDNAARWWRFVKGADWRHPAGPDSAIAGGEDLPVVHVTQEDALAYARWAGGALPTTAQWERAARGDQTAPRGQSSWAYDADGHPTANSWQGVFPMRDTADDGYAGIAPVGCFKANSFGLHDMIGNVWEWTRRDDGAADQPTAIIKGGSFLCAMNYCANFRPAAWQAQERDLGTSHVGFRLVYARG